MASGFTAQQHHHPIKGNCVTELTWYDFLEIGVDFIDADHKRLLLIMQETKTAITQKDFSKASQLLTTMLSEAAAHFEREELYLLEVGYPELENHKQYHRNLLVQASATKRVCEEIRTDQDIQECFDGMVNFLIDDVLKGDVRFKSFLEYHGHLTAKTDGVPS